jgi:hypothetical protein
MKKQLNGMKSPLSDNNKKQKDFITIGEAKVNIKCKSPKWLKVRRRLKKSMWRF